MTIASHLEFVPTFIRAASLGCAAFLLAVMLRTAISWRQSRPNPADVAYQLQRRQAAYILTGVTLLVAGIVINHLIFIVRDEPFHYGTILMVPGYIAIGFGMLHLNKFLHLQKGPPDVDRSNEHQ